MKENNQISPKEAERLNRLFEEQGVELDESRKRLNAIFKTAVDCIIIIDARGVIQMINPAVTKLFGYEETELTGERINLLMPTPHREKHDDYLANYHRTGKKKIIGIGRDIEGKRKNGTIFPLRLAVSEVKTSTGAIYVGMIHDLTARKEIEEELKHLNQRLEAEVLERTKELSDTVNKLLLSKKKLEFEATERKKAVAALRKSERETREALSVAQQLNEMKSRFVTMASHEFRTPLSAILSSTALIGRYTESDQQPKREKHIGRIKSAVTNLTMILNDFLSLEKLEEGKIENQLETFDFNELCGQIAGEMEGLLKKGQQIFHESEEGKLMVNLDPRLLKNILFNLISNAIKYSEEGKSIFCITKKEDNFFTLKIKDEGIGIPIEDQEHLFSRFFRAGNVTNIEGTGLGLNIVRKYVELMGGSIDFESEPEIGSTFTVRIPI